MLPWISPMLNNVLKDWTVAAETLSLYMCVCPKIHGKTNSANGTGKHWDTSTVQYFVISTCTFWRYIRVTEFAIMWLSVYVAQYSASRGDNTGCFRRRWILYNVLFWLYSGVELKIQSWCLYYIGDTRESGHSARGHGQMLIHLGWVLQHWVYPATFWRGATWDDQFTLWSISATDSVTARA